MDKIYAKIRSWGDKNTAVTYDGETVTRQDAIWFPDYGMVKCTQYELHFVYDYKGKHEGAWTPMCTCGSPAGIVSIKELSGLVTIVSNEKIIVCQAHTQSKHATGVGRHADGSTE